MIDTEMIHDLCEKCGEENERYRRRELRHFEACFNIFKLAFGEQNSEAFQCVYKLFEPQARRWVYRHPDFSKVNENADYFAHNALVNMYLNINKHGFHRFSNVQSLMAFLKTCVFSIVKQALREKQREAYNIDDVSNFRSNKPTLSKNMEFIDIWKRIIALIPDENDRLLVHCSFVLEMRPSAIAEKYPDLWSDARAVTVALFRIRQILRNDLILKRLLGIKDDDSSTE